jgi:GNAT superfamily N-acetyltransferase
MTPARPAQLIEPRELATHDAPAAWSSLSVETIASHAPDASMVVRDGAALRARCSLWWRDVPPLGTERLGAIGHYAAVDAEDGRAILDAATAELGRRGCTFAVGPMDGNTWHSYRLVVDRGTEPPFFLEPTNPEDWPGHFAGAGFTPVAEYYSSLIPDLGRRSERAEATAARLTAMGVRLRTLDLARFDDELRGIYAVASVSFQSAFLYTPLPEAEFSAQYQRIRQFVRPELVLIAEHEERLIGFSFNVPDVLEPARGATPRTVIVKTLAILPEPAYTGLGGLLVDRSHVAAQSLGYERAIHALMHESNRSRHITARAAQPMRRYALFGRALGGGRGVAET